MKHGSKNRPSPFPGRMSKEATKPGFSFCVFILHRSIFVLIGECVLLMCWVLLVHTKPREWFGERLRNEVQVLYRIVTVNEDEFSEVLFWKNLLQKVSSLI